MKAIKNDALANDDEVERLEQLTSLQELMDALPGLPGAVFRSWFSEEEWQELEVSETSIASANQGRLRTLRLKRQKQQLDASCEFAIDLTVRDEEEVNEQSALVQGCTTAFQVLLSRVGMNARGTVRLMAAKPAPVEVAAVKEKGAASKAKEKVVLKELEKRTLVTTWLMTAMTNNARERPSRLWNWKKKQARVLMLMTTVVLIGEATEKLLSCPMMKREKKRWTTTMMMTATITGRICSNEREKT